MERDQIKGFQRIHYPTNISEIRQNPSKSMRLFALKLYKTYQNVARKRSKKAPDARTGNGWQPKFDFEASPLSRGLLPCSLVVSSVQTPEIADMPLICGS
jgi:hypothetical protein